MTKREEQAVKKILELIGENPDREGLKETPQRVAKMWKEIFRGYDKTKCPKVTTFFNSNDGIVCDEMISDTGPFYSHCEHHMVPFMGQYFFAYVPHPKGKILGLSKVGRIVDYYSAKLQIQERLVHQIVEHLWDELSIQSKPPLAMGLIMEAEHLCKTMRGVKKKGKMRSTKLLGTFKTDPAARAEFFNMIKGE